MDNASLDGSDSDGLLNEIEQLRAALESANDEITGLARDRDRLTDRLATQARDVQRMMDAHGKSLQQKNEEVMHLHHGNTATVEELRVAMEELQVLAEELEATNTILRDANNLLDRRVSERTEEIERSNAALRISEASFRAVTELVPDLLWRADRDGHVNWWNKRWQDHTGIALGTGVRPDWRHVVHADDRDAMLDAWRVAVTSEEPFLHECRIGDGRGDTRWFLLRAEALRDEWNTVSDWFGTCTDIHEQRVAFNALQASERRFRTLMEGIPQLVWRSSRDGEWTWASPQWCSLTGQTQEAAHGQNWMRALHPDDRATVGASWTAVGETGNLDFTARLCDVRVGSYRHFRFMASPVPGEDGKAAEWLGTATDVNETQTLQDQQRVLVAELQHRTRNVLAVVQSVADSTLRRSDGLVDFGTKFRDRLGALARAQNLLCRLGEHDRVCFDELLRAELAAHGALGDGQAVTLNGPPDIRLRSGSVQILALALHELATNALKHGALGQPGARLSISWTLEAEATSSRLRLHWTEAGVRMRTPDAERTRRGQGRDLLERALPYQLGATTRYLLAADGVRCSIDLPLATTVSRRELAGG